MELPLGGDEEMTMKRFVSLLTAIFMLLSIPNVSFALAEDYTVSTVEFSYKEGESTYVPAEALEAGEKLYASVTAQNSGDAEDMLFSLVMYKDNAIYDINTQSANVGSTPVGFRVSVNVPDDITGCYAVAFLWDNFGSMNHIVNSSSFPEGSTLLSTIKINGAEIAGFSPAINSYTYTVDKNATTAPEIEVVAFDSATKVEIENKITSFPGSASIKLTNVKGETNTYTVKYVCNENLISNLKVLEDNNLPSKFGGGTVSPLPKYQPNGFKVGAKAYQDRSLTVHSISETASELIGCDYIINNVTWMNANNTGDTARAFTSGDDLDWINFTVNRGATVNIFMSRDAYESKITGRGFTKSTSTDTTNGYFVTNYSNGAKKVQKYRYSKHFEAGSKVTIPNQNQGTDVYSIVVSYDGYENGSATGTVTHLTPDESVLGTTPCVENAEIVENSTPAFVTVTGKIDGYKYGEQYRVILFDKDKTYDSQATYTDAKIKEDIIFISQIIADENGKFSFSVNMEGKEAGFYSLRVNGKENDKIFYAIENDKIVLLSEIETICAKEEATAVTELEAKLDLKNPSGVAINMLRLTDKAVSSVDSEFLSTVLYKEIKADGTILDSSENFVKAVNKAAHVAALNEGTFDIEKLDDELGLDSAYVTIYNEKLTATAKESVVNNGYLGKKYLPNQIRDSFNGNVALAYINNFATWKDAQYFVENIGADWSLNVSGYNNLISDSKSKLYDYILLNATKVTITDFVGDVNTKISQLPSVGSGDSDGNGGSGGTGGSKFGNTVSAVSGESGVYSPIFPEINAGEFSDMQGYDWAVESVNALRNKGVVTGTGEGKYEPSRNVTREEILVMLMRAFNCGMQTEKEHNFNDVMLDAWYAPYVAAGFSEGYINGVGGDKFGIGKPVTRQDVAVMAYRIAKASGKQFITEGASSFNDENMISEYAREAVGTLKSSGILNGKGNNNFAPKDSCTRAEVAKIVYGLIK